MMTCDCSTSEEERIAGLVPCGIDCLNRLLFIECDPLSCPCGELCTNRQFQLRENALLEPFKAGQKGFGLRTKQAVQEGGFIIEYVGEVIDMNEFQKRIYKYEAEGLKHHYFMQTSKDSFIDATKKGNYSRFINHSCDPNCETQKWTVLGEVRVSFFAKRDMDSLDEITFDYQYETYGTEVQKCLCGAANCRGYLGVGKLAIDVLLLPVEPAAGELPVALDVAAVSPVKVPAVPSLTPDKSLQPTAPVSPQQVFVDYERKAVCFHFFFIR